MFKKQNLSQNIHTNYPHKVQIIVNFAFAKFDSKYKILTQSTDYQSKFSFRKI